jgi:hypothetical protein
MDQVQIDGRELSCHDETVQTASKKQGTIRQLAESAGSPIEIRMQQSVYFHQRMNDFL